MRTLALLSVLGAAAVPLFVFGGDIGRDEAPRKAVCVLHPTEGNKVRGVIHFVEKDGIVEITGEVMGLAPGKHGFHVHEWGDCACTDATCAGSHFNPTGAPHGGPASAQRHVGDLGNIEPDASGKAVVNIQDRVIALQGAHSIVGRALLVHADPDDLTSQPTGNAGARLACGVIGIAKP